MKKPNEKTDYRKVVSLHFIKQFLERSRRELKFNPNNVYLKKCTTCSFKYIGESVKTPNCKQRDIALKSDIKTKKTRSGLFRRLAGSTTLFFTGKQTNSDKRSQVHEGK